MAGTYVAAKALLEQVTSAAEATKAKGKIIEKKLSVDVSTLDDTDEKRALLSGALLATHEGGLLSVPHEKAYHQGRLRVHAGGRITGCARRSRQLALRASAR